MDKQIYNAIQKQLIIDNSDQPIQYQHTGIDNTVKNLVTLEELYDIFETENMPINCLFDVNHLSSIFKYDTSRCIMIIDKNDQEFPLNKCKQTTQIKFIKIFTDKLIKTGNEIIIYPKTDEHQFDYIWGTGYNLIMEDPKKLYNDSNIDNDIYGYDNTQRILNKVHSNPNRFGKCPAAEYCNNQIINNGQFTYKGYLPAAGQLAILAKYISMINYILNFFHKNSLGNMTVEHWTSSEQDDSSVYVIFKRKITGDTYKIAKYICTIPFYKKIS